MRHLTLTAAVLAILNAPHILPPLKVRGQPDPGKQQRTGVAQAKRRAAKARRRK